MTWINLTGNQGFSINNLPYGIFKPSETEKPRVGVAIGSEVLDLYGLSQTGLFGPVRLAAEVFLSDSLNPFISTGKDNTGFVRQKIQEILLSKDRHFQDVVRRYLYPQAAVIMLMPVKVGNYTDFYASEEHATNVGTMFRGADNALMPNWKHLPVAYHGRASSIVVSGTDIHRPKGQTCPDPAAPPVFGPSKAMDFELEVAFVVGKETALGETVPAKLAEEYIFGFVLFNDWSARDIQRWEYVPLGPFLGKNFGSSISPWVVPIEALDPFRVAGPEQNPPVLPYLKTKGNQSYDIGLEVLIQPENGPATTVCRSNFKHLYWNVCQLLAHHTVNGCNLKVGDMLASGTISGKDPESFGSMLELTWNGKKPLRLADGSERSFLHDGDTVIMRGYSSKGEYHLSFGEVRAKLLPAR